MSTLMFWNKQNANNNANNNGNEAKNGKKEWLHAPDALVNGHVAYLVKFLGATPVDQAKGIETVKDAIRRLQFSQQIKKAEGNANKKTNKVELTISVDGVAVQEPRAQKVLHQFPLHDISYCADEKGVKKFFSFIAKTSKKDSSPNGEIITNNTSITDPSAKTTTTADGETHTCFVFISSKLASDITMTIGQAFELAYRRYVSDGTKGGEVSKLHADNKQLENTVAAYQQRLKDLSALLPKADVSRLLAQYGVRDLLEVRPLENGALQLHNGFNGGHKTAGDAPGHEAPVNLLSTNGDEQLLIVDASPSSKMFGGPTVPPRNGLQNQINSTLDAFKPSVGTKLEGLLLHSDSDSDFDPRADESDTSSSHTTNGVNGGKPLSNDLFGFEPPKTLGQQLFTSPTAPAVGNGNGLSAATTNGTNGTATIVSGNGYQASPTPLLAPPPKAITPRRPVVNNNTNNVNSNGSQDLFGSTPFNAMQPSPFDDDEGDSSFGPSIFVSKEPANAANTSDTADVFDSIRNLQTTITHKINNNTLSNPFGDPDSIIMNKTTHSAFDDSFDRGFGDLKATMQPPASIAPIDPFAAFATSSPANQKTGDAANRSDLSGINFSAISEDHEPKKSVNSTALSGNCSSIATAAGCKPNYHAFYTLSEVTEPSLPEKNADERKLPASTLDIFQSVAATAFQQFGNAVPSGSGFARKPSTDMSPTTTTISPQLGPGQSMQAPVPFATRTDMNAFGGTTMSMTNKDVTIGNFFGGGEKNNFNTKTMAFDDFTLESLDPLRK